MPSFVDLMTRIRWVDAMTEENWAFSQFGLTGYLSTLISIGVLGWLLASLIGPKAAGQAVRNNHSRFIWCSWASLLALVVGVGGSYLGYLQVIEILESATLPVTAAMLDETAGMLIRPAAVTGLTALPLLIICIGLALRSKSEVH